MELFLKLARTPVENGEVVKGMTEFDRKIRCVLNSLSLTCEETLVTSTVLIDDSRETETIVFGFCTG